jgi:hypothetical protein
MSRWPAAVVALALGALLGVTALNLTSRGHPVTLPLDDAYIYLQYARTAADGSPGSYFPGEPRSSGFTSPLWVSLLAAEALLLPGPGGLPAAALLLDALAAALTLWLAWRLAERHGAGAAGAWAAPFLCLLAPVWFFGAMNGMETGAAMAGCLAAAWVLAGGVPAWLILTALVRPEGAVLALGVLAFMGLRRRSSAGVGLGTAIAVAGAALVTLGLPWLLTGRPATAWTAKALLTEPKPEVRGFYFPRLGYFFARALWFGLTGGRPQPPLGVAVDVFRVQAWSAWVWVLFTGGGALTALAGRRGRGPLVLWVLLSAAALTAVAWDAQNYRYLVAAYPLLAVAATAGWFGGGRASGTGAGAGPGAGTRASRSLVFRRAVGVLALLVVAAASVSAGRGLAAELIWSYRGAAERLAADQVQTGEWIRRNLEPETGVAAHDVGAIAFYGERPVVDLVGLTTPALAGAYRHGEGALWEALSDLPPDRRPRVAAVVPAWMPELARTTWFGREIWSAENAGGRRGPVSRNMEIHRLDWGAAGTGPGGPADHPAVTRTLAALGWREVDAVDVADLASEGAHRYRQEGTAEPTLVRDLPFADPSIPRTTHALDGGRDVAGTARFRLRIDANAGAALVVARTASPQEVLLTARVGAWSDTVRVPRGENAFAEPGTEVPADVMARSGGRLEVVVEGSGYRVFHWWVFEKRKRP